jgi:predicted nuclease of predicted toxin-antitoxin system
LSEEKLRFLLDENLPFSLIDFLRFRGFTVYRLRDVGLEGAEDNKVADYASKNSFILITLDKDFGYIYHQLYRGKLTILIIRVRPSIPIKIVKTMDKLIQRIDFSRHRGKLMIATEKRVRIIG